MIQIALLLLILVFAPLPPEPNLTVEYGNGVPVHVQWEPPGERLLVQTAAGTSWVYDAETLEPLAQVEGRARFSEHGRWIIATVGQPRQPNPNADPAQTIFYDVATYELSATFSGDVTFSKDDRWAVAGGALYQQSDLTQPVITDVAQAQFSPDDTYLLAYQGEQWQLFPLGVPDDPILLPVEMQADPSAPRHWVWSPDETWLLQVAGEQRQVTGWQIGTNSSAWSLNLPTSTEEHQWRYSPDSTMLLQYDAATGGVTIREAATDDPLLARTFETDGAAYASGYSYWQWLPGSQRVIRFEMGPELYGAQPPLILRVPSGEVLPWDEPAALYGLMTSPDGRYVVCYPASCWQAGLHDADTLARLNPDDQALFPQSWGPDGRLLNGAMPYIGPGDVLRIYDPQMQSFTLTLGEATRGAAGAWSPDGTRIVSWSDYAIAVWDTQTGDRLAQTERHVPYKWAHPHPDAPLLAAVDVHGEITVWHTVTGEKQPALENVPFAYAGRRVAWQPNGTLLAVHTYDYPSRAVPLAHGTVVYIFDTATGALVGEVQHPDDLDTLQWHPDGSALYSASGELWEWSPQDPNNPQPLIQQTMFTAVRFGEVELSPEGDLLALTYNTGSHGAETLWLWSMDLGALVLEEVRHSSNADLVWWRGQLRRSAEDCDTTGCKLYIQTLYAPHALGTRGGEPHVNPERLPPPITLDTDVAGGSRWSPTGEHVAIQTETSVEIWQVNQRVALCQTYPGATLGEWRADGSQVALVTDTGVSVRTVCNGREVLSVPGAYAPGWRPAGTLVLQQQASGTYAAWDVENGREVVRAPTAGLRSWQPEHRTWHAVEGGVVRVWDLE